MILNMIQDLRKTMEKWQEMFTKELEELKNRWTNRLEGIDSEITDIDE